MLACMAPHGPPTAIRAPACGHEKPLSDLFSDGSPPPHAHLMDGWIGNDACHEMDGPARLHCT
ncbi:uncharacterized protein EI90DRAFT_3056804 [Cantharellus anzutake]|uniref:uncharacterized protein n=1 Tax=Cantharellus anzutake TaxID=1750568 RepID=UPI0019063D4C|nr:uncharacterized protein EI90DRAFT_3056804 [Cantharellus anzutake]KAF8331652.1 hypothetical protein EI90DRAFT_3056804 [Cantharellus anzutake]